MRLTAAACMMLAALSVGSVGTAGLGAEPSDVEKMFGRDPGTDAAHACFVRRYTKAHLAAHPDQNVTTMAAFVSRQQGEDGYYSVSLQVNFRQLPKSFQISGSCSQSSDGQQTLGCGVECDGGSLSVRVKDQSSILVDIPDRVRMFDPSASDEFADLPKGARFGADDKLFRLDRAELVDCLAVIYDDELKARVKSGAVTQ